MCGVQIEARKYQVAKQIFRSESQFLEERIVSDRFMYEVTCCLSRKHKKYALETVFWSVKLLKSLWILTTPCSTNPEWGFPSAFSSIVLPGVGDCKKFIFGPSSQVPNCRGGSK